MVMMEVESAPMARQIATAAARLFAARGYDATPVRAICEAAGVTKPTLYYHFGSKEGLAQALLTVPMNRLVATIRAILDGPGEPVGKLERLIEAHFAFCREDLDRSRFVYALFFGPLGSGLSAELGRFADALAALVVEAVERLAEADVIAADRVEACAAAVRGLIVIQTMDALYRGHELGPDLACRLVGDLLGGFGAAGRGRGRAS